MEYQILYEETQQPGKNSFYFVWAVLIGCFIVTMRNISHTLTILALIAGIIAILYFCTVTILKLNITITTEGIIYRCRPVHHKPKTILIEEIKEAQVGQLTLPFRYWGIKIKLQPPSYYLFGGHKGLIITAKDGKKITLGTRQPEELLKALEQLNISIERI